MPKHTRYAAREEPEERRRPRPAASSGPPILPLLALVVLIGLAIVAARLYSAEPRAGGETAAPFGHVPFASVPDERPPPVRGGGGPTRAPETDRAPAGLEATPVWTEALALAARGDAALARSVAARQQGDSAASQAAAREARDAFDRALELTATWEEELVVQYGDTDRQLRRISRVRGGWLDNLIALHKTTGR